MCGGKWAKCGGVGVTHEYRASGFLRLTETPSIGSYPMTACAAGRQVLSGATEDVAGVCGAREVLGRMWRPGSGLEFRLPKLSSTPCSKFGAGVYADLRHWGASGRRRASPLPAAGRAQQAAAAQPSASRHAVTPTDAPGWRGGSWRSQRSALAIKAFRAVVHVGAGKREAWQARCGGGGELVEAQAGRGLGSTRGAGPVEVFVRAGEIAPSRRRDVRALGPGRSKRRPGRPAECLASFAVSLTCCCRGRGGQQCPPGFRGGTGRARSGPESSERAAVGDVAVRRMTGLSSHMRPERDGGTVLCRPRACCEIAPQTGVQIGGNTLKLNKYRICYKRYSKIWRMGWDSNPRGACTPAGFQDRCLRPLGHPSAPGYHQPAGLHSRQKRQHAAPF